MKNWKTWFYDDVTWKIEAEFQPQYRELPQKFQKQKWRSVVENHQGDKNMNSRYISFINFSTIQNDNFSHFTTTFLMTRSEP